MPFLAVGVIALRSGQTVKKGKAHTRPIHGIAANTIRLIQRNPLVLTKNSLLDRTASR